MGEGDSIKLPDQQKRRRNAKRLGLAPAVSKIALELFIVFVGVSAAFAVEDYRERREIQQRREAVYQALDHELGQVAETLGPQFQRQIVKQLDAWDRAVNAGERPLPPSFKLPGAHGPPTGVWDAAAATGSIELVEPELFYELGRYYNRATTAGELYRGYAESGRLHIWPFMTDGPEAFWAADGDLRPEVRIHLQRLRDYRERQALLIAEARQLRARLRSARSD